MIVELFPEDDVNDVQSAVKMILEDRWTLGWEDDPPEGHRVIIALREEEEFTLLYAMAGKLHPRYLNLMTVDRDGLMKRLQYFDSLDLGTDVARNDPAFVKMLGRQRVMQEMARRYLHGLP
jgi:hypothetical protein